MKTIVILPAGCKLNLVGQIMFFLFFFLLFSMIYARYVDLVVFLTLDWEIRSSINGIRAQSVATEEFRCESQVLGG